MAFRAKLAKRKGRGATGVVSSKTINSHMTILRMMLGEAAERFEFETPYKNIKPLKLQKTHIEPFSLHKVQRIIDNVRPDYRNYYTVRFFTGMRTGEADGLKCLSGQFILDEFRKATREEVASLNTLQSLPRVYCPLPEVFDQLVATVQSLQSPHLREFLTRVLERKDRLEAFLNAPASVTYHHANQGGLLQHSLDVANNAVAMLRLNELAMPRLMQETCFVAGLLHDIGKTYTYDSKGKPNAAWKLCSHDVFTLANSA